MISDKHSMCLMTTMMGSSGELMMSKSVSIIVIHSLSELQQVMVNMGENLSEAEVTRMMEQADTDSDGLVSFEEFVIMMAK